MFGCFNVLALLTEAVLFPLRQLADVQSLAIVPRTISLQTTHLLVR